MNHTVLVCDDAIFMRTMISDILSQAGFEVVGEAESGSQAVEKFARDNGLVDTFEQAVDASRKIIEVHEKHWPGWEGEAEVRQIMGPDDQPGG